MSREDFTGRIYGELTVLRESKKRYYWVCQCSCGELTQVSGGALKQGYTKSCGHIRKAVAKAYGINAAKYSKWLDSLPAPTRRRVQYLRAKKLV